MSVQHYITASCIISNNVVYKNGKPFFRQKSTDVSGFLNAVYKHLDISYARYYKMDNLNKLGWLAAEMLLKDSLKMGQYQPEKIGLILSNANASLDTDLRYQASIAEGASPSLFVYTLPNIVTGEICIRNNFKGEDAFFITEKFNSQFIHSYVNNLLINNTLQACICGWVELVGNEYKAALFLVEKTNKNNSAIFTSEEIDTLFEQKEMTEGVYIAGIGAITAIGNNAKDCYASLLAERAGMAPITYLGTVHRNQIPVAEVKLSNEELLQMTGLTKETSRTTLLSLVAAKEALSDTGIGDLSTWRTGFVSANTVGGMDKSEDFFVDFLSDNGKGKLRNVFDHECGSITEVVADQLGIKDYMTTISTACSSSANAIFYGSRLIKNNILDVVIAGGADSITKFTLNGFNTLMILDREFCKPFDENRKGLNLGEGAGYVVLVSDKVAKTLNKQPYCKLSGYNNSNDAYHQTASSPDGTGSYLAMQGALKKSGLAPDDISYINLHGTGTPNNDNAEGSAVKRLFDPDYPPMSSTKAYTGHTLGASGAIEAVFSVLAIQNEVIYPNLRFEEQMQGFDFAPVTTLLTGQKVNHVMSNSFGFGGNCTSLIFSKI